MWACTIRHAPAQFGFGVAVTTSLLILGWVIADGSWWPYVSGMALGSVGWWALDRAAHRIGGRQR